MNAKPITIVDVTLRDGHQQPGLAFTLEERLEIAGMLRDMGVDVIEAGFPANPYDKEPIYEIAKQIDGPKISALARVVESDIDAAYDSLKPALEKNNAMIHLFIGTSDMLMENSHRKKPEEVSQLVKDMITYARNKGFDDIEFSPEDATRTEPEYLHDIIKAATDAGVTRINIPDTVGYTIQPEFKDSIREIIEKNPKLKSGEVILSVHCHNDLEMAVANTLAGIEGGAAQFEGTINGIGERAGNANIFPVIMALRTRQDYYKKNAVYIDTPQINSPIFTEVSQELDRIAEMPTYANRAITGTNAHRDSSGIHAAAVERNPGTYHIIDAMDVGSKIQIVIGPTSGQTIVNTLLEKNGYNLNPEHLEELTEQLKGYSISIKDSLTETEALVYIKRQIGEIPLNDPIALGNWKVTTGSETPYADVEIHFNTGQYRKSSAEGVGTIDAATTAILDALNGTLKEKIRPVKFEEIPTSEGFNARAHAQVALEYNNKIYWGRARDLDIVKAGIYATMQALNAIYLLNDPTMLNSKPIPTVPITKT